MVAMVQIMVKPVLLVYLAQMVMSVMEIKAVLQAQRRALMEVEEAALEMGRREAEEKRTAQRAARLAERRAPPPLDPRGRRRGMRLAAQAHPRRRIRRGVGHRNDGRVGRHDPTTPRLPRRLIIVHPGIE